MSTQLNGLREVQVNRRRRAEIELLQTEARIKSAEAQLKVTAARRAEDERLHEERMRDLEYGRARRAHA
jgi:hypothetical protein